MLGALWIISRFLCLLVFEIAICDYLTWNRESSRGNYHTEVLSQEDDTIEYSMRQGNHDTKKYFSVKGTLLNHYLEEWR